MTEQSIIMRKIAKNLHSHKVNDSVLVGFDGFVDDIIAVIDKRKDVTNYSRIETISKYAERIGKLSNVSGSIELDTLQQKLGGNAPIMGNALIEQGFRVNTIATIGTKDSIHPVFKDFASKCSVVIPIANPGNTLAFEFQDGKIMMNQLASFSAVNWDNLLTVVGEQRLKDLLKNNSMLACVNWAMLPFMSSIYVGLTQMLKEINKRMKIFVDVADIMRRTKEDIVEMLKILSELGLHNDLILGLNYSEALQVLEQVEIQVVDKNSENIANVIRQRLKLPIVVIHETKRAVIATSNEVLIVDGPYAEKPKLTTGAGDNFNAGFCSGWQRGYSWVECLYMGVYTSGYYVRNACSPTSDALAEFIEKSAN